MGGGDTVYQLCAPACGGLGAPPGAARWSVLDFADLPIFIVRARRWPCSWRWLTGLHKWVEDPLVIMLVPRLSRAGAQPYRKYPPLAGLPAGALLIVFTGGVTAHLII